MTNKTAAAFPEAPTLGPLELEVLIACQEVVTRQHEMLPFLASALQVPESEVFYTWAFRKCWQHGDLEGTDWSYFFHGLECDLRNRADGRFLRIDFGPGGRVDTITAWGALQFIMTSAAPWHDYSRLKDRFGEKGPPYDEFSGDLHKFCASWDELERKGVLEKAAPELLAFKARHTSKAPEGFDLVRFPKDIPERTQIDCDVAGRSRISEAGLRVLSEHAAGFAYGSDKS